MKEDLSKCCGNIKDFLFTSAHRNCRVMDPTKNMAGLAASEIWGSDPVHPKPEIYDKLADGIIAVEKSCGSGQVKRKQPEDGSQSSSTSSTRWSGSRGQREPFRSFTPRGRGGDGRGGFGGYGRGHGRGFRGGFSSSRRGEPGGQSHRGSYDGRGGQRRAGLPQRPQGQHQGPQRAVGKPVDLLPKSTTKNMLLFFFLVFYPFFLIDVFCSIAS